MKILKAFPLFLLASVACSTYLFAQSAKQKFIDSLLKQMTLDEKIGQMTLFTSDWDITGPSMNKNYINDIKAGKVGAIFNAYTPKFVRQLQQIAVEQTRLHIPLMFGYDDIHGHKTIFPIPLGEACSWDLNVIENAERIAATEASADGLNWTFAPMVDIARDPRWGRITEGAGEDPFLGSLIAQARVKGFQGKNLGDTNTIVACAKHFAAYGAVQAGRDYNTVDMSERTLREVYLPPYKACIDAGVGTVMTSFNEINGIPSSGNKWLLNDLLKKEWHFNGFVVTDYTSINEMVKHGFSKDEKQAGEEAANAGVDMDMQGAVYENYLKQSINEGKVRVGEVDSAVLRILSIKYDLGLFADPYKYCNEARQQREEMSASHLAASREVARKSIVLLKDSNQILPLNKNEKIAFIGPLVKDKRDVIGSWSAAGDWKKAVSFWEGVSGKLNAANVFYAKGTNILSDSVLIRKLTHNGDSIDVDMRTQKQMTDEALAVATKADVIVAVMGESEGMTGEAASRSDIGLPQNQVDLLKALKKTGKPVVLILMNGRPLTLSWENQNMNAILETWFLGSQAGNAIADVLFGNYNPSGKLTITFPRSVGQIPIYYAAKNTGRPFEADNKYSSKYLDIPNTPLYPFGYGLSYTTFRYSDLSLNKTSTNYSDSLQVTVSITNSGKRDGEEIVQLYTRDWYADVTRPVKELKGFQKVFIKAGETKKITFMLRASDLKFYDQQMNLVNEEGKYTVFVGRNSADCLQQDFQLSK